MPSALGDLAPMEYQQIQGKNHPTYGSILDRAHRNVTDRGFTYVGCREEVVQAPTMDNGMMAIVYAELTFEDDAGKEYRFGALGDATPDNVTGFVKPAFFRMASTRAKGRAMREALNIAEALDEEVAEGTAQNVSTPPRGGSSTPAASGTSAPPAAGGNVPKVFWGEHKGKLITDPSVPLKALEWGLGKYSNRDKTPDVASNAALEAEVARRNGAGNASGSAASTPAASTAASTPNASGATGAFKPTAAQMKNVMALAAAKGMNFAGVKNMCVENFGADKTDPSKLSEDEFSVLEMYLQP